MIALPSGINRAAPALGDAEILCLKPSEWDLHRAEHASALHGPMPVRPPTHDEAEMRRERGEPLLIVARMTRMPNLDTVHSGGGERFDHLASSVAAGMREDRNATRLVNQRDSVGDLQAFFVDIGGLAGGEIPVEGLARVFHETTGDQRARHVRPTNRAAVRRREHRVDRHGHTDRVQLCDDLFGARAAMPTNDLEVLLHRVHIANVEPEQMHFILPEVHAELDPGDDAESAGIGGDLRLSDARESVVIGEGEGGESGGVRRGNGRGRARGTVRGRGVRVQIHMPISVRHQRGRGTGRGTGRARWRRHGAYPASGEVTLG